jgi:hypothetical protein
MGGEAKPKHKKQLKKGRLRYLLILIILLPSLNRRFSFIDQFSMLSLLIGKFLFRHLQLKDYSYI